jgi:hypothetical protein
MPRSVSQTQCRTRAKLCDADHRGVTVRVYVRVYVSLDVYNPTSRIPQYSPILVPLLRHYVIVCDVSGPVWVGARVAGALELCTVSRGDSRGHRSH